MKHFMFDLFYSHSE